MPVIDDALIPPTLSDDFCSKTPQEQANELISGTQISSSTSFTNLLIQAATPTVAQRAGNAWFRLEGADLLPDDLYKFAAGNWQAKIWPPASSDMRMFWRGSEADLWSFDGGDGTNPAVTAPTATTGAVWERDTEMDGRLPMGIGDIPGVVPTKTLAVDEAYGSGNITQTAQQVAAHTHPLAADANIMNVDGSIKVVTTGTGGPGLQKGLTGPEVGPLSVQANTFTTSQEPMNIVPPVMGGIWARRTARTHRQP